VSLGGSVIFPERNNFMSDKKIGNGVEMWREIATASSDRIYVHIQSAPRKVHVASASDLSGSGLSTAPSSSVGWGRVSVAFGVPALTRWPLPVVIAMLQFESAFPHVAGTAVACI
jgi:hypothetical protein